MLKRYHQVVSGVFRLTDSLVILAAWVAAYALRFYIPLIEVTKGMPSIDGYLKLMPMILVIWVATFSFMRVYHSRRLLKPLQEVRGLLQAHGVALVALITISYLVEEYRYSRVVMVYFAFLGGFGLVLFRLLLRGGLRVLRSRGHNLRHILIVGNGRLAQSLVENFEKYPELGMRVKGVLVPDGRQLKQLRGVPALGHFSQIEEVVAGHGIDQVMLALPRDQYPALDVLLRTLKDSTVGIQLVPDLHEYLALGFRVEEFEGIPMVNLNDNPQIGWGAFAKRATDFVIAAVLLVLLSPIFLIISVAIKLTTRGKVFYTQERLGLDGSAFQMVKFCSMHADAESKSGAQWAVPHDERCTPFGRFLRSTSLDELPQLWNVVRGDMSLVGPRPERPIFVRQFRSQIPNYMLRHKVKAGMTGWAQINGWRGNTSLDRRVEYDLYYIRNWSYLLDLKILGLTLWKGFLNRNAY